MDLKKIFKIKNFGNTKSKRMFEEYSIFRSVLTVSLPSVLTMFVLGAYIFIDNLVSINFASEHINNSGLTPENKITAVRLSIGYLSAITSFVTAVSLLVIMGTVTRFSIALGRGDQAGAKTSVATGFIFGLSLSIAIALIVFELLPSWFSFEAGGNVTGPGDAVVKEAIRQANRSGILIIWSLPFNFIANFIVYVLRSEGKVAQSTFLLLWSVLLNLGLAFAFTIGAELDSLGSGLATFVALAIAAITGLILVNLTDKSYLNYRIFKHFQFSFKLFIVIALIGLGPFIRNFSNAITATLEYEVISNISPPRPISPGSDIMVPEFQVYLSAVLPIFSLFFPSLFGFSQGAIVVGSYNYGAGNIKRTKQTTWICIGLTTIYGIIIYFAVAFGLIDPLMRVLALQAKDYAEVRQVCKIVLASICVFGISIGAMSFFQCTDRIIQFLISCMLRGIILFIPLLFIFQAAIKNGADKEIFWYVWFVASGGTSVILAIMLVISMHNLKTNHVTKIAHWIEKDLYKTTKLSSLLKPWRIKTKRENSN